MSEPQVAAPNIGWWSGFLRTLRETLRRLLTVRGLVVGACTVILLWFVIWLVFALITRAPFQAAVELSGLLAALGGMMGAIFTAGGLVVALVSVLTQIQLQDRVTGVLTQAQLELKDRFENELRPSLEEQAHRQVEGMFAFSQATTAADWRTAQRLTREALDTYPNLVGARRSLGLRLSNDVETYFWNRLHHVTTDYLSPYSRANSAYLLAEGAFIEPPWTQRTPIYAAADAPKLEAIDWLTQALDLGEESEGQVTAALTLMYGVNEAYDKMLESLSSALAANTKNRDHFLAPDHLAMLAFACGNNEARLHQLGDLLSYPLPIAREQVVATMSTVEWAKLSVSYMDWYALNAAAGSLPVSGYPSTIRIFQPRDGDTGQTWFAYVFPHTGPMLTIPSPEIDSSGQHRLPERTLDDLVGELSQNRLFLCPSTSTE